MFIEALDFQAYWTGFQILLEGGNPYDYQTLAQAQIKLGASDPTGPVFYSPLIFFLLAPVLLLPFEASLYTWFFANIIFCIAAIYQAAKLLDRDLSLKQTLAVFILFIPFVYAVKFGQVSALVALSVFTSIRMHRDGRPVYAGLSIIPALLKPHLVVLPLIAMSFDYKRIKLKFIAAMIASLILIFLSGELLFPGVTKNFLNAGSDPTVWMGHSPITLIRILSGDPFNKAVIFLPLIFLAVFAGYQSLFLSEKNGSENNLNAKNKTLTLINLLGLNALVVPYIWVWDFVVLTPLAVMALFGSNLQRNLFVLMSIVAYSIAITFSMNWESFWLSSSLLLLSKQVPRSS